MKEIIQTLASHARSNTYVLFLTGFAATVAYGLFKLSAILETL